MSGSDSGREAKVTYLDIKIDDDEGKSSILSIADFTIHFT